MKPNDPLIIVLHLMLLCAASPLVAQEINTVNEAIDSIRKYNYVCYLETDGWGNVPRCWVHTQTLARHADDKTLNKIARENNSSVVKAIAGRILIGRKSDLAIPLVFDILHNKNSFLICYGDVCEHDNVANFLIEELFKNNLVSEQDSLRLVDSLLFAPDLRHLKRRAKLLESLPAENQYYSIVKRMYVEEHDGDALIALARFQREEDTVYVLENLRKYRLSDDDWIYYWYTTSKSAGVDYHYQKRNLTECALLAVAEWPHEQFKPLLSEIRDSFLYPILLHNTSRSRYFFSALMAYRSPWALDMIEQTFEMIKNHPNNPPEDFYKGMGRYSLYFGESFDRAYELNPDQYFDELHKKYGREK